jgi:hypothetical protein
MRYQFCPHLFFKEKAYTLLLLKARTKYIVPQTFIDQAQHNQQPSTDHTIKHHTTHNAHQVYRFPSKNIKEIQHRTACTSMA